jgi:NTP pyrophosphatase (non-canonical NTP hydrolase)
MKEIEERLESFLKDRGWDTLRPGDVAKSIAIESGELLEIFQWDNPPLDDVKKDVPRMEKIRGELADVLIYCLDMAVLLNIDTKEAIFQKLEKAEKKYPVHLFNKGSTEEPGTESAYWEVKKKHR